MNNKLILATSGMGDTENLFNCINDLIANTKRAFLNTYHNKSIAMLTSIISIQIR
jgi:hypothetical protein